MSMFNPGLVSGGALGTPSSGTLTNCTGLPQTGVSFTAAAAWTPADGSGAGLSFTSVSANYVQIGNMVFAYFSLTFPSTANASAAVISGLPVAVPNQNYAIVESLVANSGNTAITMAKTTKNASTFALYVSGAPATNAALTTLTISGCVIYPAA